MFFPIRTDRRLHHTPWVNIALIAANVVVFVLTKQGQDLVAMAPYTLHPNTPTLVQYISYQFLHANWAHLMGNMLFLYVFGNSVEDRLGKVGYLGFYLAGGVMAGLGHALIEANPVLGASGSVAAVTGAYLALFPLSNVTVFYWFFLIGTFEISGIMLILFQVGYNVLFQLMGDGGVAYLAHLSGYAYGFMVGMSLLRVCLLPREAFDMLTLLEQRRRRTQFRSLTRRGCQPWEAQRAEAPTSSETNATSGVEKEHLMRLRQRVSEALNQHNLDAATDLYATLLDHEPASVMSQQPQLDLANHLMLRQRYDLAARAYELFLNAYKTYTQCEQVELILGLIYVRYLDRRQRAHELLTHALSRLRDDQQRALAQQILADLE